MKILMLCFIAFLYNIELGAQTFNGDPSEINILLQNMDNFSKCYIDADYDCIADAYTVDGKIFPNGTEIIEGREAIKQRWTLPEDVKILNHKISPSEITIVGDTAYDYGYYEGKTLTAKGESSSWKGKYVIIWKKTDDLWKMYLDIWNRVNH